MNFRNKPITINLEAYNFLCHVVMSCCFLVISNVIFERFKKKKKMYAFTVELRVYGFQNSWKQKNPRFQVYFIILVDIIDSCP